MNRLISTFLMAVYLITLCFISPPVSAEQTWSTEKAIDLVNGVPVTGVSGTAGEWLHYRINVSAGSSNLTMRISGGTGDADLYTKFGSQPTSNDWDCRPYQPDSNEECTVATPQTGYYYVSILGYEAFSNLTLEASFVEGVTPVTDELINGQARTLSGVSGEWKHFFVNLPANSSNLVMEISGGTGDADLYTRFNAQPTSTVYDCRPYLSGNNEQCTVASPQVGQYHVSVFGYADYSNLSLKASYVEGTVPVDKTFIITAVYDNLDNTDMYILADGLTTLGYTKAYENTNVSTYELIDYLGRNVTTVYHTGHGDWGSVYTSDGYVAAYEATLRAENTFFATCLTLGDTSWESAFASTAQTLMGYTDVSYDFTDDTVCQNMVTELGNNRSYQLAWYLSNSGISSLSDRWAEYVREGNLIVEYSARTGNIPSAGAGSLVALEASGRVKASQELVADTRTFESSFGMTAKVSPATTITYTAEEGFDLLGPVSLTENEALPLGEEWLAQNGGLPGDAVLDRVTPVRRRLSSSAPVEIVGYSIRYHRTLHGLRVSGNRVADHISILIGRNAVIAASRYWPDMSVSPDVSTGPAKLLPVSQAVQIAAGDIAAVVKGSEPIHLIDAEPVYGTYGPDIAEDQLHPAYKVRSANGHVFVIDASTGELLL